jgi:sterol 24-C-methyltransferase
MLTSIRQWLRMKLYLWKTRIVALYSLATLSNKDLDAYYNSYLLFEGDWSNQNGKQESHIVDYYFVLNHLCALGNVEKMYIPPLRDPKEGIIGNQLLYERKMMQDIGLALTAASDSDKKVLDIGCGRGRVALHVAQTTGAFVCGMNLDESQIANAKRYANMIGMSERTHFQVSSLNDTLPYADESFDAAYNIQAFTYSQNKVALFQEIYRILKPGAKFSMLDWVLLDNYDPNNAKHVEHIQKTMPFIGAIDNIHYSEFEQAMTKAGFKILLSEDASIGGHQAPLIQLERKTYAWLRIFARFFLPRRFRDLLARLKMHAQHFVDADELRISTSSYQIVCQKPPFDNEAMEEKKDE